MRVSREVAKAKADAGPVGAPRLRVSALTRTFIVRADLGAGTVSVLWPAQAAHERPSRSGRRGKSSP
jgi:hypothetical protein